MQSYPSRGCCQLKEIYGFGHTKYDGANSRGRDTVEEFEKQLSELESANSQYYSINMLTLNDDQYKVFGSCLAKNGWQLVNVANSLGHPTVIFVYIKNSHLVSKEVIATRLEKAGIDIETVPVQRKRKMKKVVDKAVG